MEKPREFFIDEDGYAHEDDSLVGFENSASGLVHVIEYSAYDEIKEKYYKLKRWKETMLEAGNVVYRYDEEEDDEEGDDETT